MMFLVFLLVAGVVQAQAEMPESTSLYTEVYLMRTPPDGEAGVTRLIFVDAAAGHSQTVDVRGERFTLVGDYVLYVDPDSGVLYRVWPDGRVEAHPFIQPVAETQTLDWVVSPNHRWIVWLTTNRQADGTLQTVATLADAQGTTQRVILTALPDAFVQLVPLALTDDGLFFFDRQPQGLGGYFFYPQYASIYRLDTEAEAPSAELLPFEPNCFCGAGLSPDGNTFARLERVSDAGGYHVRVWDLAANIDRYALSLPSPYEAAGAVLVAPDGKRVIYSLANNVAIDSANSGRERFMLAVVDVDTGEQTAALYNQFLVPLLPLAWTEDGSGVMLYNPRQDGTWKLILGSGEVRQVASGTWLGVLGSPS